MNFFLYFLDNINRKGILANIYLNIDRERDRTREIDSDPAIRAPITMIILELMLDVYYPLPSNALFYIEIKIVGKKK